MNEPIQNEIFSTTQKTELNKKDLVNSDEIQKSQDILDKLAPPTLTKAETEEHFDEEICQFCGGHGAISRSGSGQPYESTECECCGTMGTPEKLKRINDRDDARTTGVSSERMTFNIAEQIFHDKWRKEILTTRGVNGGHGILQLLMSPALSKRNPFVPRMFDDRIPQEELCTERDYKVAATVIQWLGTNIGRCFIDECRREIDDQLKNNKLLKAVEAIATSSFVMTNGKFCLSCHASTRYLTMEELDNLLKHFKIRGYPNATINSENNKKYLILYVKE